MSYGASPAWPWVATVTRTRDGGWLYTLDAYEFDTKQSRMVPSMVQYGAILAAPNASDAALAAAARSRCYRAVGGQLSQLLVEVQRRVME